MQLPITTKEPHEIQEVADFEHAKATLEAFRQSNPQFFQHYDALVEDYNQKREAAEKAVRAEGVRCGSFDAYQRFPKYDWPKLYASLGRERFIEAGGIIKNKKELKGDNRTFEMALAKGVVPRDVAEACTTEETRYHIPPAAVIL